ncbi:MAG TPA: protein-L-isoaspartate(D-aspartate) O-methyltransferase [Planctomycetota bacterium]|nr:MAG: Protein-L-isoaspartate O-methyltransferase [Planctomycetes bacterium ADurb.Bin069]HNS00244.1 protein-L-isoaspartate(D-aspartate) O-methyltransferase [Planctomycetota bacterium]HNU26165.1 protein-L-isoaspartate(D-aspartate) O-methyltransferase [Planctomycetota bacterium]HOE28845.1 protein-L-isoaspartate(D-aspartate) O-methyltransferase [Planctomycetota bacterium]HOE85396.1 protein-L-isoaspartate(D-aspartate) O-methyltransferase [Planctomycetota bacterium]
MKRLLAYLGWLAILAGCTQPPEAPIAPDETDFTMWLVRAVAAGDEQARRLLGRWDGLCASARALAADARAAEAAAEARRANAREARALLEEARRFLSTTHGATRLVFTAGRRETADAPAEEKWDLRAGEQKLVILQVANKTEEEITAGLSGCASGGFYVWPWDRVLAPGESLFSLLLIQPLAPGDREGFIALDVTTARGGRIRSEIKLRGRFQAAPPREAPPGHRELVVKTIFRDRPHPAALEFSAAGDPPELALLSNGHMARNGDRVTVYSPGEVRLAAPSAELSAAAAAGPALRAERRAIDPAAGEVVLRLDDAQPWLDAWSAGAFRAFAPETLDLNATLLVLGAEGFAVGHLSPADPDARFGPYPAALTETLHPGGSTAVWAVPYEQAGLGAVLGLNLPALKTRMTGIIPGARGAPDLLAVCDEIHNSGGSVVGISGAELPLLALLGRLDALALSADTLPLWYDVMSCGTRLAPAAVGDGEFSRTYVHMPRGFTYERYVRGLAAGMVFVTGGPLIALRVNGRLPGEELHCGENEALSIECSAWEAGREAPVEVLAGGEVIGGTGAFSWRTRESTWIAARAPRAHTGVVHVVVEDRRQFSISAAERLLGRLARLDARADAGGESAALLRRELARGRAMLAERLNAPLAPDPWAHERARMVQVQLRQRAIADERVLRAMEKVPRHRFVPESIAGGDKKVCYADYPLSIGWGQTISQPYIVAFMTEALALTGSEKVLEIGTGSGYQAAVLAELVREVYTIEIVRPLCERAEQTLRELNYRNVRVRFGDGYRGWPEEQPFDAIIVTAAPDHVPPALVEQLAPGGRMVVPVGTYMQALKIITKDKNGRVSERDTMPVLFVPMTGEAQGRK